MKYIVIHDYLSTGAAISAEEHETKEEALKNAEITFAKMCRDDKKHCDGFYVLESVNPDEEAEDHMDGEIIRDFLKEWKENGRP